MNIIQQTKKAFTSLMNIPNIPLSIKTSKEPKLLHISDTPSHYHNFFLRVIQEVNPQYVVHTGDLVDDIKLENNPHLTNFYKEKLMPFIAQLEKTPVEQIYLVLGNHDNKKVLLDCCTRCHIVEEGKSLTVEHIPFQLAHNPKALKKEGYFFLYGHNFKSISNDREHIYLNGIHHMHVILLHSKKVIPLSYPYGINHGRKMTPKGFGI